MHLFVRSDIDVVCIVDHFLYTHRYNGKPTLTLYLCIFLFDKKQQKDPKAGRPLMLQLNINVKYLLPVMFLQQRDSKAVNKHLDSTAV